MNFNHDSGSIISILTIDTTVAPPLGGSNTLQIVGTGGLTLPSGESGQRPAGVPAGTMRWNSTDNNMETYNGSTWVVDGGGTVTSVGLASAEFTGTWDTQNLTGLDVTGSPITSAGTITVKLHPELTNLANIAGAIDGPVVRLDNGQYVSRELVGTAPVIVTNGDGQLGDPTISVNAELTGLSTLATVGGVFRTGAGTYTTKTFAASGSINLVENATSLTFSYTAAGDLAALEALGTGIVVKTGTDPIAYAARSIVEVTGQTVVTNGSMVGGNATIGLAEITQADSGNFRKVTLDGYGRVTGNTAVLSSDITALVDSIYVNVTGDTMTGNLNMGGGLVTGLGTPVAGTDATNKNYVDALATGLTWKQAARVATTANVDLAAGGLLTIDGVTLVAGDRVLVKSQTNAVENGIYVAAVGTWTRSLDMDEPDEFSSATLFVQEGSTYADTAWTQVVNAPVVIGTTELEFTQFAGSALYTAGVGLALNGNTFDVNLGAGIAELPTDGVGIDIRADSALFLSVDGTTSNPVSGSQLTLRTGAGISQNGTDGIYIATDAVTNGMIANSFITVQDSAAATDTINLGETVSFVGATTPITTAVASNTVTIAVADATTTTKGLASFTTADFSVTAGAVSLVAKPISSLTDVQVTTPSEGDLLVWNATSEQFENVAQSAIVPAMTLDGLTDVTIATVADNQILQYNSGTSQWENVSLATAGIQASDAGLTSLAGVTGVGFVVSTAADGNTFATRNLVAGTGISITGDITTGDLTIDNTGVTSVGLSMPSIFTVTGSPVTTTGDLTATLNTQAANLVFAGPVSGAAAVPTFRALVPEDIGLRLYKENGVAQTAPTATGNNSVALGSAAGATLTGELAHASGSFAVNGDAQSIELVLRNTTTNATETDLFLDGAAVRAVLSDDTAWVFTVQVVGLAQDAHVAGYRFDGVIRRETGVSSVGFAGTPSKNILGETVAAWDANVVADTTNGALAVRVIGEAAKAIRWVATIRATKVIH
jgi:hypothetical protein